MRVVCVVCVEKDKTAQLAKRKKRGRYPSLFFFLLSKHSLHTLLSLLLWCVGGWVFGLVVVTPVAVSERASVCAGGLFCSDTRPNRINDESPVSDSGFLSDLVHP